MSGGFANFHAPTQVKKKYFYSKSSFMNYCLALLCFFLAGSSGNGAGNACKYPIDERPIMHVDDHLQGIWKMREDTNFHNYIVLEKADDYSYSITYMDHGGDNRGLEHGKAFFSEIDGTRFLQVSNWDFDHPGMIFLKVLKISEPRSWDMTAVLVTDTTLYKIKSSAALRSHLQKNLNNPNIYGKELHFRKKFEFNSFK